MLGWLELNGKKSIPTTGIHDEEAERRFRLERQILARLAHPNGLGLLLYELLTGRRPFWFAGMRLQEVDRIACEQVPARPSAFEPRFPR